MSAAATAPVVAGTRAELEAALEQRRHAGEVVLVPTMGALHQGHADLLRAARARAGTGAARGAVVVSVFVNPTQFAPGEDLDRYPRTFAADLALCAEEGVDVVFAPGVEEVYPGGVGPQATAAMVTVDPGPLGGVLEGRTRPTHFRGVLGVVARLLGLVRPDAVLLGEKDYQQLVLVRAMAADLCLGVDVVGVPTRREPDGLALSSRNAFLDPAERARAVALHDALSAAGSAARHGLAAAHDAARAVLAAEPGVDVDYLAITTPALGPLPDDPAPGTPVRILVAARVGATRLIDNVPAVLGADGPAPAPAGAA